jgi:hypothetical protein
MIKTNDYDALVYDLESQVVALKMIMDQLSFLPTIVENQETHIEAQEEIERLKYFARQYCTHDEFDELDKLRKEHSLLVDEIEAFSTWEEIQGYKRIVKESKEKEEMKTKEYNLEGRSKWFKRGFWNGVGEKNLVLNFAPGNLDSHEWKEYGSGYNFGRMWKNAQEF